MSSPVAYAPHVLRSLKEICEALGVGPATVKKWLKRGAPVAFERDSGGKNGRYSAELGALQQWRVSQTAQDARRRQ